PDAQVAVLLRTVNDHVQRLVGGDDGLDDLQGDAVFLHRRQRVSALDAGRRVNLQLVLPAELWPELVKRAGALVQLRLVRNGGGEDVRHGDAAAVIDDPPS